MVLALRWVANGDQMPQPSMRLARIGRWRPVGLVDAKAGHLYGPGGIMVSLLVGMLINVPVRATEFLAAIPAPRRHFRRSRRIDPGCERRIVLAWLQTRHSRRVEQDVEVEWIEARPQR